MNIGNLSILAPALLAAFLALYYALACGTFVALARTGAAWGAIIFVAGWTLAELARARWLTGFPWGAGGYAHVDGLLAGYAPWLGAYGLGAVAAWVAECADAGSDDGDEPPGDSLPPNV